MTNKKNPLKGGAAERCMVQIRKVFAMPEFQDTILQSIMGSYEKSLSLLATADNTDDLLRAQGEYKAMRRILDDIVSAHEMGEVKQRRRLEEHLVKSINQIKDNK